MVVMCIVVYWMLQKLLIVGFMENYSEYYCPRNCLYIIIIIFIRINNYTYRVHIKYLSTNYIKIFRIENKV